MTARGSVLGVDIAVVERDEAADLIIEAAERRQPFGVSALAVHGVMEGVADSHHRYRLNDLELVVADGHPVRWALRWLHGYRLSDRVCGPDLMADVCHIAAERDLPIFMFGSTPETIALLESRLPAAFSNLVIAGTQPSRFRAATEEERAADIETIGASGARIVFVGLGCPRQEVWTWEMRDALSMPVVAIGAAFDFHAGTLERAPLWMQRRGLEWFYRLSQEPTRLWRRYVILNPKYLVGVGLQRLGLLRIDRGSKPNSLVRPS